MGSQNTTRRCTRQGADDPPTVDTAAVTFPTFGVRVAQIAPTGPALKMIPGLTVRTDGFKARRRLDDHPQADGTRIQPCRDARVQYSDIRVGLTGFGVTSTRAATRHSTNDRSAATFTSLRAASGSCPASPSTAHQRRLRREHRAMAPRRVSQRPVQVAEVQHRHVNIQLGCPDPDGAELQPDTCAGRNDEPRQLHIDRRDREHRQRRDQREARNLSFHGDGSFHTKPGLGCFLRSAAQAATASSGQSWLPIHINEYRDHGTAAAPTDDLPIILSARSRASTGCRPRVLGLDRGHPDRHREAHHGANPIPSDIGAFGCLGSRGDMFGGQDRRPARRRHPQARAAPCNQPTSTPYAVDPSEVFMRPRSGSRSRNRRHHD